MFLCGDAKQKGQAIDEYKIVMYTDSTHEGVTVFVQNFVLFFSTFDVSVHRREMKSGVRNMTMARKYS